MERAVWVGLGVGLMVVCGGCGAPEYYLPPKVEPRPIGIARLLRDLPAESPAESASALAARARVLTSECDNASISRPSPNEVAIDVGSDCPVGRGAFTASFHYDHGAIRGAFSFDRFSLADGDVLHGQWGATLERPDLGADPDLPFIGKPIVIAVAAAPSTVASPAQTKTGRCVDRLGEGVLASGKIVAELPLAIMAWPLLLLPPIAALASC